jgi:hypothetical protein
VRTWTERVAAIGPRAVLTEPAWVEVCRRVNTDAHAVAAVARDLNVGGATIMRAVDEHGIPLVETPHACRGGRPGPRRDQLPQGHPTRWVTGLVDLDRGRLLNLVADHTRQWTAGSMPGPLPGWPRSAGSPWTPGAGIPARWSPRLATPESEESLRWRKKLTASAPMAGPRQDRGQSGSRRAATGVRNDRGARPTTVEDHDRRCCHRRLLTWRFSRVFPGPQHHAVPCRKHRRRSRTEEPALNPLPPPTSALITSPAGRLHWPTPFQISSGGHLAISPKSA